MSIRITSIEGTTLSAMPRTYGQLHDGSWEEIPARAPTIAELRALLGPSEYTKADCVADLLRFMPMTSTNGNVRQTAHARSWRSRFARELVLCLRGVPPP